MTRLERQTLSKLELLQSSAWFEPETDSVNLVCLRLHREGYLRVSFRASGKFARYKLNRNATVYIQAKELGLF